MNTWCEKIRDAGTLAVVVRRGGGGTPPQQTRFFVVLFIFTSRSSKQRVVGDADPYGLLRDGRLRVTVYATTPDPHPPRRGRRPRRPFPSATADPTTFLQPLVGAGFHPRLACVYHRRYGGARRLRGCGRRGPPAKGEPPARVPPLTPSCASLAQENSARCGARPGLRPWTPPAFL